MGHGAEDYVAGYRTSWDREQDAKREAALRARAIPKSCGWDREHDEHFHYSDYPRGADFSKKEAYLCPGVAPLVEKWRGKIIEFHQDGTVTWRTIQSGQPEA